MPHFGAYNPQIQPQVSTMHLATKFHHPMFNRLEVIVLTNKHTNKQTDAAENIHLALLCYNSRQLTRNAL